MLISYELKHAEEIDPDHTYSAFALRRDQVWLPLGSLILQGFRRV